MLANFYAPLVLTASGGAFTGYTLFPRLTQAMQVLCGAVVVERMLDVNARHLHGVNVRFAYVIEGFSYGYVMFINWLDNGVERAAYIVQARLMGTGKDYALKGVDDCFKLFEQVAYFGSVAAGSRFVVDVVTDIRRPILHPAKAVYARLSMAKIELTSATTKRDLWVAKLNAIAGTSNLELLEGYQRVRDEAIAWHAVAVQRRDAAKVIYLASKGITV